MYAILSMHSILNEELNKIIFVRPRQHYDLDLTYSLPTVQ